MRSARERTLPLFENLEELSLPRSGPSIRTLRRRLCKAAHDWYRDRCGYETVLLAARALDEALEAQ